jgi:hypothetical protein
MTAEEAVGAYTKIFGGFPYFLFMGASEEVIVDAVEEALRTGEEIQAEEEADY